MQKAETAIELHYFSERLRRKLDRTRSSSASIIEAPSGYGKTTAVRDYLESNVSRSSDVFWFTAVDEEPDMAYRRLCLAIGKVDADVGKLLFDVGIPNAFTLGVACEILRSMECNHDVWLVIDNFQFLCGYLPPDFICALLEHGGKGLHVIIVTQMLGRELRAVIEGTGFLSIGASDLRFQPEDIQNYFTLAGIGMTKHEAQRAFRYTDGWAIAVYLQYCAYRETGGLSEAAILPLMERLIWDRLTPQQQDLYLRISPFEAITVRQICALLGETSLPDYASTALANPFVYYDQAGRRYELHSILAGLIMQKRLERGGAFDFECLLAAGDLCNDEGRTAEALAFYLQAKDYDKVLSLDLSRVSFREVGGRSFFSVALELVRSCPAETRRSHPLSMLRLAWALKASGEEGAFGETMAELDGLLGQDGALRAEWLLLSAYQSYPSLCNGLSKVRQAAALFDGGCSRVIKPDAPWCFGNYSQMSEFHVQVGDIEAEAEGLEEFLAVYSPLTGGHGSGAGSLFRAEAAYYQGDMAKAEIHAYKAAFLAEGKRQTIIQLGAAKVLADIALVHADIGGWQQAMKAMERAASPVAHNTLLIRSVLDIVKASILNDLQEQDRIAAWLKSHDFSSRTLMPPMADNALFTHVMYLLQKGELLRFVGTQEAIPSKVVEKTAFSAHLFLLLMAIGHYFLGSTDLARDYLERSVDIVFPDKLLLSVAPAAWRLDGLVEELIEAKYPSLLDAFAEAKEQYGVGWVTVRDALSSEEHADSLTAREREIALYAAEGLRNSEIASRVGVSESTVRAHLRTIFQKLGIDRRGKLAEKLK